MPIRDSDGSVVSCGEALDRAIEAQKQVIRHVLEFMEERARMSRAERTENGRHVRQPRVAGIRLMEAELRERFDFDEHHCNICSRWLPSKQFYKHPNYRSGLQPKCKVCERLARIYGGANLIPSEVLMESTR